MATGVIPDITPSHSHAAPGSDTQVTFNDGGIHAADAGFTYNKTTDLITLAGLAGTGSRRVEASSTGLLSATRVPDRDLISDPGLASAVAEIIVTGIFTSTYRDYEIEISEVNGSTNANIHARLYSGASPVSTNAYYGHVAAGYSSSASIQTGVYAPATQWHVWLSVTTTITHAKVSLKVHQPAIAAPTVLYGTLGWAAASAGGWGTCGGQLTNATAYDGIGIFPGAGTITGRVRVYGLR